MELCCGLQTSLRAPYPYSSKCPADAGALAPVGIRGHRWPASLCLTRGAIEWGTSIERASCDRTCFELSLPCRELIDELRGRFKKEVLEKSPECNTDPGCTPWLQHVPKHPHVTAEVDLDCPEADLDEVFFSPLAEQAEDAAWFVCSPSGAERSSVSDVETSRQRLQAPSAGDVATSLMWCAPLLYTMHPSSALVQYRVVTLHGLRSARMPN